MQTNEEKILIAKNFIKTTEFYLNQVKQDLGTDFNMSLPMNQSDFEKTLSAFDIIQEMGKEKGIDIQISDEEESINEYGHNRCIYFSKI